MKAIHTSLTNEEIFAIMPPARNYRGETVTIDGVEPFVFDTFRRLIDFGIERAIHDGQVAPVEESARPCPHEFGPVGQNALGTTLYYQCKHCGLPRSQIVRGTT